MKKADGIESKIDELRGDVDTLAIEMRKMEERLEAKIDGVADQVLNKLDERLEAYVENVAGDKLSTTSDHIQFLNKKVTDHEQRITSLEQR